MTTLALTGKIRTTDLLRVTRQVFFNAGLIAAGCIIFTYGMNGILVPRGFLTGGITGISMLVHYQFPGVGIGLIYLLLNVPLAVLGWRNISRRFMAYTLFGTAFFSMTAALIRPEPFHVQDPILAALSAGVICGAGCGIILTSIGSAGGFDILGIYLNKKFGLRLGLFFFFCNASVLAAGVYFYDLEMALYSMIYLFTSGKVIDAILTGFNRRKSLMVISDHAETIAQKILDHEGRGVTFLKGEGAFSHKEKKVIFTITTLTELPKMKELIQSLDPEAFIVINDTLEVLGKRHGSGRVY